MALRVVERVEEVPHPTSARLDALVGERAETTSDGLACLPVEQGVACLAALRRHTDSVVADGDDRTRAQIMADTLVERVTGQGLCDRRGRRDPARSAGRPRLRSREQPDRRGDRRGSAARTRGPRPRYVRRHADGGQTTLAHGRGLCARHNLLQEQPGWSATVVHDGLGHQPHTVRTTTPTGHGCVARAPDPP